MSPAIERTVTLAHDLKLPIARLSSSVTALLGNRGGGKSNGAAVIVEQVVGAGVQTIVLDYVGIWYGLRLDRDGKSPSKFEVPIVGGRHGDIDLSAAAGVVVAEALAASRSSAILDISLFSKSDRCRFVTDFAEAFFKAKKQHRGPSLIVLEEAQRFVPQQLWRGQERMLGAWEEIAEVGRNFGIGLMLISQRPQKINKDVLNLSDQVFAFRTNGVLERKAIHEWVQEKQADQDRDILDALPGLPTGTCYAWVPELKIFGRHSLRLKESYDSGATPTSQQDDVATIPLDLKVLEAAMGKAVEEAARGTPSGLQAECARLRKELGDLRAKAGGDLDERRAPLHKLVRDQAAELKLLTKIVDERVDEELGRLTKSVADWREEFERNLKNTVKTRLGKVEDAFAREGFGTDRTGSVLRPDEAGQSQGLPKLTRSVSPRSDRHSVTGEGGPPDQVSLSVGELRTLCTALQYDHQGGATREMLLVLTGYKKSSRDTFLKKLKSYRLIELAGDRFASREQALARAGVSSHFGVVWLCRCEDSPFPPELNKERLWSLLDGSDSAVHRPDGKPLKLRDGADLDDLVESVRTWVARNFEAMFCRADRASAEEIWLTSPETST